ncbi:MULTISPECIES: hypothetical protein [Arthrobacter]|uniref:Uncharacterized protein n=2 Tax=Arthrobacter TaxID=1663 RepID=A0ABU9KG75_9MICC|nr:hypothetical protein [Arthrobacter sp. YJM1]MDP5225875.1 hypothetical protein [Arthrobacter sp. YJM1]
MTELLRAYRRDEDGVLSFREAWHEAEEGVVVVNHGVVGHLSKDSVQSVSSEAEAEALLEAFAAQCLEDGYAEIPEGEQHRVVAQFALKSKDGTDRDRSLERSAVAALTGHFAWRGLGTVLSSSIADGKLSIFLLSPEPGKAVKAITVVAREEKLDPTKLSVAVATPEEPENFRRRHPAGPGTPFSL